MSPPSTSTAKQHHRTVHGVEVEGGDPVGQTCQRLIIEVLSDLNENRTADDYEVNHV
jgi:hypothetical protein